MHHIPNTHIIICLMEVCIIYLLISSVTFSSMKPNFAPMYLKFVVYPGGKVHTFPALFANIRGKSVIFAPNHVEITPNTRPSTHDDSACYTCTYRCENIEFSVLHVALPELA